jgi:hypothetical protein
MGRHHRARSDEPVETLHATAAEARTATVEGAAAVKAKAAATMVVAAVIIVVANDEVACR